MTDRGRAPLTDSDPTPRDDAGSLAGPSASDGARPPDSRRTRGRRWIEMGDARAVLILLLAVAIVGFSVSTANFLTLGNATTILTSVAVLAIIATGQTIAIISGGFDLSITGTVPLGAIVFALLFNAGMPWEAALLVTVAIGAAVGICSGAFVALGGINPLIVTLGVASITAGAASVLANGSSVSMKPAELTWIGNSSFGGIANDVWMALAVILAAWVVMRFTPVGLALYALGGNREATWLAGLHVRTYTFSVYVVSGALAAFAGAILTSQLLVGSPTVGSTDALDSIAAVVLGGGSLVGGLGDVWGTAAAVLLLGVIADGLILMEVSPFYQEVATGVVLLLAITLGRTRLSDRRG